MKSRSRHCNQTVAPRSLPLTTTHVLLARAFLALTAALIPCSGFTRGQSAPDSVTPTATSETSEELWKNIGQWFDFDSPDNRADPAANSDHHTIADRSTPDAIETTIPTDERPRPRTYSAPTAIESPAADSSPQSPTRQELKELSEWIRSITLMNLPPNFEDNRKWGRTKSVYDGFHLSLDGLRVDTKRKWKTVKHGTWSRYFIEFIDPAERLRIDVTKLEVKPNGRLFSTSLLITMPLKLFGRVSQFQRDIQWISVSTKAEAVVAMQIDCDVAIKLNPLVLPPDVEFRPSVTQASVELQEFDVSEISQIHGEAAEWLGKGIQKVLQRKINDTNDKLVEKINASLAKQQDKLKLSAQSWLSSSFNTSSKSKQPSPQQAP
ncbi:MAG: hypothetical protein FJ308_10730 [Planctomycetes bacterium]|nr:hypothetical protein [Planctomycetota bacterium]